MAIAFSLLFIMVLFFISTEVFRQLKNVKSPGKSFIFLTCYITIWTFVAWFSITLFYTVTINDLYNLFVGAWLMFICASTIVFFADITLNRELSIFTFTIQLPGFAASIFAGIMAFLFIDWGWSLAKNYEQVKADPILSKLTTVVLAVVAILFWLSIDRSLSKKFDKSFAKKDVFSGDRIIIKKVVFKRNLAIIVITCFLAFIL
ncbi:hypothetical protein GOV04_02105 [Candidatus Woesearchaeota archaeon]|nr:hypothetical protein [Candidatus Woesearchaeota archaeon]